QSAWPIVRPICLGRGTREIAEGVQHGVTTFLKFTGRHLEKESSSAEADIRESLSRQNEHQRRHFIQTLCESPVRQVQGLRQRSHEARDASIIAQDSSRSERPFALTGIESE